MWSRDGHVRDTDIQQTEYLFYYIWRSLRYNSDTLDTHLARAQNHHPTRPTAEI